MDAIEQGSVGYMKFSGRAVPRGVIGANAGGTALLGFDECLRFFAKKQAPALAKLEYEIPVKTTEGSWLVIVLGVLGAGATIFGSAYLKKAGEKMAENDFKDVGFKDVLRKSVDALRSLVELVKHTKGKLDFGSTDISWRVKDGLVGVANDSGEVIFIPIEFFRWYLDLPPGLLFKMTSVIEEERVLTIGAERDGRFEETTVTAAEKVYFGHEAAANEEDLLFPELEHGAAVRLEGHLTRGNEDSNSVGLKYKGHILNCVPESGNIKRYKPALFLTCIVEGTISRLYKQSNVAEKKPTIIFSSITPIETDDQIGLFGG